MPNAEHLIFIGRELLAPGPPEGIETSFDDSQWIHGRLFVRLTPTALILPWIISAFGVFLLRQFFRSVPDEILYAARLDELGEVEIIWRIIMPMSTPVIAAFGIFSAVAHWNDLFRPLIAVRSEEISTAALAPSNDGSPTGRR
ncbi:ABC transporter permease subunit (plasmid) [Rhizobium sp. RCAM05350]|uniref:ABC transporter permease subunit n=1 Tax=Rhizobium sp. RCAM05350 TaxID=2895568 RepID=UPI002076B598|nr:ABC transporter permease subunit [Rhizobium sp. RCAM05350]URK89521.1 ABC transporter permease subunit [Rhizobium sp. RCAM05350]